MNEVTFEQIISLVEKAITLVAFLALYKSIPASLLKEVRQEAGHAADKTETPLDNILLQIYDYVDALFAEKQLEQSPAPVPAEPLYNASDADRSAL